MDKVSRRREQVKILVDEGKSNQEIAEELKVNEWKVAYDISILRKEGKISEKIRKKDKNADRRREQVKKLVEEGKSNKEIAEQLGVKIGMVATDVSYLKAEGKISKKRRTTNIIRREQVKKLVEEGNGNRQIAEELGIKESIVTNDIAFLRKEGQLTKKRVRKTDPDVARRREKIKELMEEGKKYYKEIAEELGIKENIVINDIAFLKREGKLSTEGQRENRFERIINYIKSNKEEIQQAIDYAKSYEDSKYLTEKERNKLKAFIIQAEKIQEKNILALCKKGKTIEEITKITKYTEGMIVRVYRSYQKEQKIEENENEL